MSASTAEIVKALRESFNEGYAAGVADERARLRMDDDTRAALWSILERNNTRNTSAAAQVRAWLQRQDEEAQP